MPARRLQVDEANWGDQLVGVIKGDPDYQRGAAKVLIFTKDVAAADAAATVLRSAGIE